MHSSTVRSAAKSLKSRNEYAFRTLSQPQHPGEVKGEQKSLLWRSELFILAVGLPQFGHCQLGPAQVRLL
jgi:hypothetical protein